MAELHLSGARAIDLAALDALRRKPAHRQSRIWSRQSSVTRDFAQRSLMQSTTTGGRFACGLSSSIRGLRSASPAGEGRRTAANWEMLWSSIASAYGLARRARKRCSFKPSAGTVNSGIGQRRTLCSMRSIGTGHPFSSLAVLAASSDSHQATMAVFSASQRLRIQEIGPRVSPRRPTRPGCTVDASSWSNTLGTLGRAIRGIVRFEVGETSRNDWSTAITDIFSRVARATPGKTFPPGPRGGAAQREEERFAKGSSTN
jgi:hypothetical protein